MSCASGVRAAVVVVTATLSAFAACFIKPDPPMIGGDGDGGLGDSGSGGDALDGPPPIPCTGPSDDMGSSAMICGDWGSSAEVGGTLLRTNGVLQASVFSPAGYADCVTHTPFDFVHGASIAIPQVLMGSGDTTRFSVLFEGGAEIITIQVQQQPSGTWLFATCSGPGGGGSAMYSMLVHRYLKIARSQGGNLNAYYSGTGSGGWMSIGGCTLTNTNLDLATARFGATAGAGSGVRIAEFDNFRTCTTPP